MPGGQSPGIYIVNIKPPPGEAAIVYVGLCPWHAHAKYCPDLLPANQGVNSMSRRQSACHVFCRCQYHPVSTPKHGYKILNGNPGKALYRGIYLYCSMKKCTAVALNVRIAHVPLVVRTPAGLRVPELMGLVKGRTAIRPFAKNPYLRKHKPGGNPIWQRGYFVDPAGANEEIPTESAVLGQGRENCIFSLTQQIQLVQQCLFIFTHRFMRSQPPAIRQGNKKGKSSPVWKGSKPPFRGAKPPSMKAAFYFGCCLLILGCKAPGADSDSTLSVLTRL